MVLGGQSLSLLQGCNSGQDHSSSEHRYHSTFANMAASGEDEGEREMGESRPGEKRQ